MRQGASRHRTCSGRGCARGGRLLRVWLALLGAMQRCWNEAARWCGRCEVSSGGVDRCESSGGSWQAAVASCAGSGSKPGGLGEDGPDLASPRAALAGGPALAGSDFFEKNLHELFVELGGKWKEKNCRFGPK
jgi:hypothetical protein